MGGMAITDVMGGTNMIGNTTRSINKMLGVDTFQPTRLPRNVRSEPYSAAVGTPGNAPTSRFNRGGIASLVV